MGQSNIAQSTFHGGEWSKFYQGRYDHPKYKTGMNVCFNGLPVEEGSWVRRPGTRLAAPTYKGLPGRIFHLAMQTTASYDVEFTDGNVRFFNGGVPVFTEDTSMAAFISTDNPAQLTLTTTVEWQDGDEIVFIFDNSSTGPSQCAQLRNRVIRITPVASSISAWDSSISYGLNDIVSEGGNNYQSLQGSNLNNDPTSSPTFWELVVGTPTKVLKLYDSITGDPIDGSTLNFSSTGHIYVLHLLRIASPYVAGSWINNKIVQEEDTSFVLNGLQRPRKFTISPNAGDAVFAQASLDPAYFQDGPYLDPIPNSIAQLTDTTGLVTVNVKFADWINTKTYAIDDTVTYNDVSYRSIADGNINNQPDVSPSAWLAITLGAAATGEDVAVIGFQQGDAGAVMRFLSTPPIYDPAVGVAFGDNIIYPDINGQVYQNISGGTLTGVQPDTNPDKWTINPSGAIWTWGKITNVNGPTSADVQIIGPDLLYPLQDVLVWRLGVYSDARGWPTCGAMHEGRLWLGGAVANRFDASTTDGTFVNFAPTSEDGTVSDNNGISYRLLATDKNQIFWFSPEQGGLLCGTLGGEWLIQSSTAGDPLTPSSIQAKRVTKYGCADVEPRRTGIALLIVQKYARRILEFLSDVFTQRYIAPNLSEKAKHLTSPGIAEIAYQEELAPILWARKTDGSFAGSTYRRQNSMVSEEPMFNGWHRHALGTNRTVDSLVVGPSISGKLDTVSLLTADPTIIGTSGGLNQQVHWVEVMTDIFEETDNLYDAFFVDGGLIPSSMYEDTVSGVLGVRFTGLWYLKGQTAAVFAGGLDVGDYLVDSNGTVFVPYGSGVQPAYQDFLSPGAGQWYFTADYVASVKALNYVPKNGGIFTETSGPTITLGLPVDNPATTTIQSYVPTSTFSGESLPVAQNSTGATPNWDLDLVTFWSSNPSKGLRTFRISTGAEIVHNDWGTIGYTHPIANVACTFKDGTIGIVAGNGNYNPYIELNQATLTLTNAYNRTSINGGTGTGGGSTTAAGAVAAAGLSGATGQGHHFVIDAGFVGEKVDMIDPDQAILHGALNAGTGANAMIQEGLTDEGNVQFCTAVDTNTQIGIHITSYAGGATTLFGYYGVLHTIINAVQGNLLGHQVNTNFGKKGKGKKGAGIDVVDLFSPSQLGANYRSIKKIGVINAPQINSRWSNFTDVGGICTDLTDRGTIVRVNNLHDRFGITWTQASSASAYNGGTTYSIDAPVSYAYSGSNTNVYLSLAGGNVGNTPTNNPADTHWRLYKTTTAPTWLVGTTYAQYDIVQGSDSKFYLSLVAGNVGFDPTVLANQGVKWSTPLSQGFKAGELVEATDTQVYESRADNNDGHNPTKTLNPTFWNYSQTQRNYIVKLAPEAPTVMWAVPITDQAISDNITQNGQCSAGIYIHIGTQNDVGSGLAGTFPVYIIDTTTGSYKIVSIAGINGLGQQASDGDDYKVLIQINQYDSTVTGAPTPQNSTVSWNTGGADVSNWALVQIGENLSASPIPGNSTNFPKRRPIIKEEGGSTGQFPCVVGMPYISQGQTLRPVAEEQIRSQEGPGLAKERRDHLVGFLLNNTIGIKFGTAFGVSPVMDPAIFKDEATRKQPLPTLMMSGVFRYPIPDSSGYDSMLAWQVNRPYPATVVSIGSFLKTSDV